MQEEKNGVPRRWWMGLLSCLVVLAGALLIFAGTKAPSQVTSVPMAPMREAVRPGSPPASVHTPRHQVPAGDIAAEPGAITITRAELIGQVTVDKSEVCPGEDLKISIQPERDVEGAEKTSFNVEGKFGNELVLNASMPDQESFWVVAARGSTRDFKEIVVTVLPEQHPRCATSPMAAIVLAADDWSRDTYHFEVAPLRGLGELAQVRWSFGDGATQSGGSRVSHAYTDRPQTSETSAFLVTADVVDVEGRKATARASVSLLNLYYQARVMGGLRALPVEHERIVDQPSAGVAMRLNNIEASPVRFEQATVRLRTCSGVVREHAFAASDLLDSTVFPGGQISEAQVALPAAWTTGEICRVELALTGDTEPSTSGQLSEESGLPLRPVTADLTFELGMPRSIEQGGHPDFAGRPVTDPELEAELLEVMADKGTNYLTQEELDKSRVREVSFAP